MLTDSFKNSKQGIKQRKTDLLKRKQEKEDIEKKMNFISSLEEYGFEVYETFGMYKNYTAEITKLNPLKEPYILEEDNFSGVFATKFEISLSFTDRKIEVTRSCGILKRELYPGNKSFTNEIQWFSKKSSNFEEFINYFEGPIVKKFIFNVELFK